MFKVAPDTGVTFARVPDTYIEDRKFPALAGELAERGYTVHVTEPVYFVRNAKVRAYARNDGSFQLRVAPGTPAYISGTGSDVAGYVYPPGHVAYRKV